MLMFVYFLFVKQKTAYEMRISDWSSDVCSSDLPPVVQIPHPVGPPGHRGGGLGRVDRPVVLAAAEEDGHGVGALDRLLARALLGLEQNGRASCRERVCQYV